MAGEAPPWSTDAPTGGSGIAERGAGRAAGRAHGVILWAVALVAALIAVAGAAGADHALGQHAMDALPGAALLFSLAHGAYTVGWRGIGVFFAVSYLVAFALEACSVATGFPFGFYEHHTEGPALFDIPLVVPAAYFAYGWIAWALAIAIVRGGPSRPVGAERFTTPLVATMILTGWDFTFDMIFATVDGQYTYRDPGGFFGVPVSNFLGWLLTGWVIVQIFALVEERAASRAAPATLAQCVLPSLVWALPVLPLFGWFLAEPVGAVTVGGRTFLIADIYGTAFVTGLMTLLFVAVVAAVRVTSARRERGDRDGRGATTIPFI